MDSAISPDYTEASPETYESAYKLLCNTRHWGPRLLQRTCVRYKVSPKRLLRAFCILLSIRCTRVKSPRLEKHKKMARIDPETLKLAHETLLAASSSTFAEQQHVESLLNGTQVQEYLRASARFVDADSEDDPFLSAVRSLPHAAYVSLNKQKRIAKKLGAFYQSLHARPSNTRKGTFPPVKPLTKHLARYRTHTSVWRQQVSLSGSLVLCNDLKSSAEVMNLDKDEVDVGIRAVANAFESDEAMMRYGRGLELFTDLLSGKDSLLWNAIVSAKSGLDYTHNVELEFLPPLEQFQRIQVKLGGSETIRANPQILLSSKFVSSDDFIRISLSFCRHARQLEDLIALFEAFCTGTSVGDCRRAAAIVWKEGGLDWIKRAKLKVICDKIDITADEACRLRWFANSFALGGKQAVMERVKQAVAKATMYSEIVEQVTLVGQEPSASCLEKR